MTKTTQKLEFGGLKLLNCSVGSDKCKMRSNKNRYDWMQTEGEQDVIQCESIVGTEVGNYATGCESNNRCDRRIETKVKIIVRGDRMRKSVHSERALECKRLRLGDSEIGAL